MNGFSMTEGKTAHTDLGVHHDRSLSFIDLMIILAKHKKLIILFPFAAAVFALAISFAVPKVYRANTKLLPPQQAQSGAAALLSQLGGVAGALASSGLKNPAEMYVGILKSRTIADKLVEKFKLKEIYEAEFQDLARKELEGNTFISTGKDGIITIEVQTEDPKMSAGIANAYVEELVKLTQGLALTEAAKRRLFFEKQLENAKNSLAASEVALKNGLDTHGLISVDADSRAFVETVGRLRATISAKEIQIRSMSAFVTSNNQDYRRAQEELGSLKNELAKLENGRPGADREGTKNREGLNNVKIARDVKYYQMLYELLAKQYEAARLDEANDSAVIQVLDPAEVPERKFGPKRAVITLLTGLLAFGLAISLAFLLEGKQRAMSSPERSARFAELKSYLSLKRRNGRNQ